MDARISQEYTALKKEKIPENESSLKITESLKGKL